MVLTMTLLFAPIAAAQSTTPFVPANFEVPEILETKEFRLRVLTVNKEWPFKRVAYPGREIEWETWRAIPDEKR